MASVNIGTFNIFCSSAPEAVKELINKYDLAVTGLQEVDINAARSHRLNVPRVIAGDSYSLFSESIVYGTMSNPPLPPQGNDSDERYGIALISKYQIKKSHKITLGPDAASFWKDPSQFEWEPRSAIAAQINILGRDIWFMNTHLAYTKNRDQSSPVRQAQIDLLLHFAYTHIDPQAPVILSGDLNATAKNPDLHKFLDFFCPIELDELTYPVSSTRPLMWGIDHFYTRNLAHYGLSHGPLRTHSDPSISDHKLCMLQVTG